MAEPKSFHFLLGAFILLKKDKKNVKVVFQID